MLFGLSAGFQASLDRGSLTAISGGLIGLWVWAYRRGRWWAAAIFLTLAIVLKPYLVLVLLWPLLRGHWRTVGATTVMAGLTSLIGFALLPGGLMATARGYLDSSGGYTTHGADFIFFWSHGMVSLLVHPVMFLANDPDVTMAWLRVLPPAVLLAPGLLWLVLVAWIAVVHRVSEPLVACLVLSLPQLVLPSSGAYTAVFAGVGALVLLTTGPGPREEISARWAMYVALTLTIVPIPLSVAGGANLGGEILSPVHLSSLVSAVAWLTAGIICALVRRDDSAAAGARQEHETRALATVET
jgi:hypothetical protein